MDTEIKQKRLDRRKELENQVNTRMGEPYTQESHDLVLYYAMWAKGVRIADIDRLIAKAIAKDVPIVTPGKV